MNTWQWPQWIAHRAGGCGPLENTLAGVQSAARHGFRAIEVDVQLSADVRPVVIHDETLLRTTGHPGRVDERTAAELGRLPIAPSLAGESGVGGIIPELGELLVVAADLGLAINLELKAGRAAPGTLARAVLGCLQQLAWAVPPGHLLLSSFDHQELRSLRAARADLPLAVLSARADIEAIRLAQGLGAVAVHLDASGCTVSEIEQVRGAGLRACAWTVNDPAQAQALFALGVGTLFTDRMDLAQTGLSGATL